ncbi:uncharacterized protein LOC130764393 isoform X1 [Actinidia eriantha]|uniref:uncharacterized protein LOC130764393 isoform X1 n=1 Tax=Actinidia eriantha TaxID=165200 RepID=UPI00258C122E|nr:uncharacterized protein LOC130764393 isoform X1 [Actinidia eriantha]
MGIFSESPKSFKMDRKSPLASILKSSISNKLLQFLGSYTDDVLADYIIVLVCNGKHQIEARDDLEAFLGERSSEFVSWLWDHLLKYAQQSNSAISLLYPKDSSVTIPSNGGADRDLRSSRSKDAQSHGSGNADISLYACYWQTKNEKDCHPSVYATSLAPSNSVGLYEGSQYCKGPVAPSNGANTNKAKLQKQTAIASEVRATENIHDESLTYKPSKAGSYFLIPAGREHSFECLDKPKRSVNHKGNGSPNQLMGFSRREKVLRNMQPSIIDGPGMNEIYSANVPARSLPGAAGDRSCQSKKVRGSVWDRLGKAHEVNDETVDARAIDIVEKDQEGYEQHILSVPVSIEELYGSIKNGVHELDKSCSGNGPGECTKPKQAMKTIFKLHAANNIRRKRHFDKINSCPSSHSDSLVGRGDMDHQHEESPQDFKRLNSTSEAAALTLVTKVQDVKQRMRQIEMEMSKLRTKQLEMKKDGQPHVLTNSGVIKHSEEDVESRTVFVTNVHFAATKEALSFHFAKCGVVLNVVILTDLNAQPKGSAYIIFANKESVDKAVALSGTSFFSRTLKVTRKAEETPVTASVPQLSVKPIRTQLSQANRADKPFYPSSHLQWRRESVSSSSEPSATITQVKAACDPVTVPSKLSAPIARVEAINSAASQQQISSSPVSVEPDSA